MFDLKNLSANGHQQLLVASMVTVATGLSVYYALAPSKKSTLDEKAIYRSIPIPKSRLPYFGKCVCQRGPVPSCILARRGFKFYFFFIWKNSNPFSFFFLFSLFHRTSLFSGRTTWEHSNKVE
jgi:hypothetical protein